MRPRRLLLTAGLGLALLAPAAPAAASSTTTAGASIIGGGPATIAEFPSVAYLEAETGRIEEGYACTGTVIAPRLILTAGHCVEDVETGLFPPARGFAVATGVANLRKITKANVFRVARTVVFPGFDPGTMHGDAGLLILATPTTTPPIALANGSDGASYVGGSEVRLAGWGLEGANASSGPAVLQATSGVLQESEFCKRHTGSFYPFYSPGMQICATHRPGLRTSACYGDSGGPLIGQRADGTPLEVGVISTGGPGCSTRAPNIFTRVDRISTWAGEWIAAVELGAPEPVVKSPPAGLPRMSFPQAKILVLRALAEDFGRRIQDSRGGQIGCDRINRARVRCEVSWFYGPDDYFGTITVYYAVQQNAVTWKDRYRIKWVNDRCWFQSGHRRSCKIHSQRG